MTWLKLSDDFNKDCRRARISDAAFRVHVEMLCFVMDDENGGLVNADDVIATSRATRPMDALRELLRCGFWTELTDTSWQIIHQMEHQPDPETLAARRKADADRQQRSRRRKAGLDPTSQQGSAASRRDTRRDPGRVGSGLAGENQGPSLEEGQATQSVPAPRLGVVDLTAGVVDGDVCSDCMEPLLWCKCHSLTVGGTR